ncbi:hypothetical protein C900_04878 [Fulvivirga imtechensis AK7]|uniref:Uncharacterized protein n=1 Tax=Fulvivirga imtechensis AK7 TaxID=1237149 RepID=L8JN48_9BACT|nr:hypothetical protein [Fulvivirga imtechensis]ELR69653.1 hypothetical protein C900_04878 [Fulvivirga imtechensis AK7]
MIYGSIVLFALAAVLGLIIAAAIFKGKETPKPAVYAHGAIAAIGLVLLVLYALQNPTNYPQVSLIIFVIAALGGFYLFANDMKKKPGPKPVVIIHALAAVTAFTLLLLFVLM